MRSSVVLPEPEGPSTPRISPRSTLGTDPEVLVYFTQSVPGAPFTSETIAVLASQRRRKHGA